MAATPCDLCSNLDKPIVGMQRYWCDAKPYGISGSRRCKDGELLHLQGPASHMPCLSPKSRRIVHRLASDHLIDLPFRFGDRSVPGV